MSQVSKTRWGLGAVGVLGIAWGVRLIFDDTRISHPWKLFEWLAGAVILHDSVLVPTTLLIGAVLTATIPARARRYIQGGLIASALVTAVAVALIYRQGDQPNQLALLQQDYAAHLAIVVGIIVGVTAVAYSVRVLRDRQRPATGQPVSATNVRSPADQHSATE